VIVLWLACSVQQLEPDNFDQVIEDPAFEFCHEAGVYAEDAEPFCEFLDDLPLDKCPGLRESCAGAAEVEPSGGCQQQDGASSEEGSKKLASEPVKPPPRPASCDAPKVSSLASLLRWVMALGVAAVVLIILRVLIGWFGTDLRTEPVGLSVPVVDDALDSELDIPDLPSDSLLDRARRALAEGQLGDAVLFARAAALRGLDELGAVRLHRSRTDREYVRSVAKEHREHLRAIVSAVETHRWGGRTLPMDLAKAAVEAAARILPMLLLSATAYGQTPYRYGPEGDVALHDTLDRYGYQVAWRLRPLTELDDATDVLILDLSGVATDEEDWAAIRSWVELGHVLMVAGSPREAFPELGSWADLPANSDVSLSEWSTMLPLPRFSGGPGGGWIGGVGDPLVQSGEVAVVTQAPVGLGVVVAISDARFFWNGGFVLPDNEAFVGELLYFGQGAWGWPMPSPARVELATQNVSSTQSNSPPGSLSNARLLPFVLQLFLFWIVVGMWRGWPFGPLRDPPNEGRRRFVDHVGALARRYHALGASRRAAGAYSQLWLARVGRDGIERRAKRAGHPDPARFGEQVEEVAQDPDGPDDMNSDLNLVETLWKIMK
jgi:hypothetical protein